jgi:hypothetical protein
MAIRVTSAGLILSAILLSGSAFGASRDENLADPIVAVAKVSWIIGAQD